LRYESSHQCDTYGPWWLALQDGSDPEIDSVNKFLRKTDVGSEFVDISTTTDGPFRSTQSQEAA